MKHSIIWASLALAAAFFSACSGVVTPKAELAYHQDSVHNIPAIDSLIVSMKQDYIKQCYMPVASHMPPENSCSLTCSRWSNVVITWTSIRIMSPWPATNFSSRT